MGLIEEEQALVLKLEKFSIPQELNEEDRKMILNPLGYDAIKDIDELHNRNRSDTDDPYIRATSEKIAHFFPKIEDAERR